MCRAGMLPAALVELIIDRTDGNPFFVEEVVKMLIDDGGNRRRCRPHASTYTLEGLGGSDVPRR